MKIVARKHEIQLLETVMESKKPEFVAIYGRRRVGKTYLIREFFNARKENFYFECTGQKDASISVQIDNFCYQLESYFSLTVKISRPRNWTEAFRLLNELINLRREKSITLFFDELPWFAGARSLFVQSLDYAWNQFWSKNSKIKLIVCGSAASWMNDHLVNASSGLHNRITRQIRLDPFRFDEITEFVASQKLRLTSSEILKLYMIFGGVPYYWQLMPKGKSAAEIVDMLLFKKDSELRNEFHNLFRSLFDDHAKHEDIVKALAKSRQGLTRSELLVAVELTTGGTANKYLRNLELSGFIEAFIPFGNKKKEASYRLIDEFCLFHLYWAKQSGTFHRFWSTQQNTPSVDTWAGYAFENFCLQHKMEIARALQIEHLIEGVSSWRISSKRKAESIGAQIDLIFSRKDGVIHLIEIKYSKTPYKLDKDAAKALARKVDIFKQETGISAQIFTSLVTSSGYVKGLWDDDVLDSAIDISRVFN